MTTLPNTLCFLNGQPLPLCEAKVSVLDRGFIFGDGVYEVIPVYARRLLRFDEHVARLARSLDKRRSLFEARDAYVQASPTFVANRVNEPVLVLHGEADSNPGTLTLQSRVFFEAVRGSGGTARLVLLPFEDHGYRARETIEHVLWEQIRWFDEHVKNAE